MVYKAIFLIEYSAGSMLINNNLSRERTHFFL